MPAPLAARGIIITVSVLVAASLAAYENPQVRAWIQRTRHKIAMGLHSLGDEIGPRQQRHSNDVSMHEEKGELAEARRQRAVAEIMERGRVIEEQRKRRKIETEGSSSPSFDNLVDEDGHLRHDSPQTEEPNAATTAVDAEGHHGHLRQRTAHHSMEAHPNQQPQSPVVADALLPNDQPIHNNPESSPFESKYEREMREAWNIPLSDRQVDISPSHASESLIELTPTTEDFPDPDFSIPSAEYFQRPMERSDYFSAAASSSSHTLSDRASLLSEPHAPHPISLDTSFSRPADRTPPASSTPSVAGSVSHINFSEAEESSDDLLSEIGDGIRTPGSTWTDVDSTISGDR